ncbi:MAG: efflux RND transporter periplasmic adaptor subunit [Proteobacteria bacterium]|nr:efflux RND transporter periplasmic adaptor subunit [Pseudomonadota bacterium]
MTLSKLTLPAFAALCAALALAALGCKPKPVAGPPPQMPPPQVTVAAVEQQDLVEWDEFTGRTAAVEYVEVRPRVSGHLMEARIQSGQLVKKGDLLFVIDPRAFQAELNRRLAELQLAQVKVENAKREADRSAQLLANKAISTEEAESRQSRHSEAKATLLAAQAACDAVKLDLEYCQITAPISGRVSRELVNVGNYVSGLAGATTLLTTIVSVDPVHVYADVDENSLLKFNALTRAKKMTTNGDGKVPVELQLADEDGFPHKGHIESFDNKLDSQSGSILMRAVFPNPDGLIVPGLFARVRVPGSAKYPALLVSERAIGTDQAQKFVLTLTSTNTVAYRPVKLGASVGGKRIVRDGLQPGEKVVLDILFAKVRPGMPVTPKEGTNTTGEPNVAQQ